MPEEASDRPTPHKAPRRLADYAAIEKALQESPRGRAFLAEYAKRNRAADTQILLEAITKLELAILKPHRQREADNILGDLIEMSEAIARTRCEIAAIKPPSQIIAATEELDNVVKATEKATSEILEAAEEIQETAWILREKGTEEALCDTLDERATNIYMACSFQDLTGQRTEKVVKVLHFVEQRINAMIDIWGLDDLDFRTEPLDQTASANEDRLLSGPLPEGKGLKQDDVDAMLRVEDALSAATAELRGLTSQAPHGPAAEANGRVAGFDRPEPLTLAELQASKRAALFG